MDFSSRQSSATSSTDQQASPRDLATVATAEEPEYLSRYLVVKHTLWRGRYKRILCISHSMIITLHPNTLAVTNSYNLPADYEFSEPVMDDESLQEFKIKLRRGNRGKFEEIKMSSPFRASILTELHRLHWPRGSPISEFSVLHLRRRTSEWIPFVSR